jgi:hypothetical protein
MLALSLPRLLALVVVAAPLAAFAADDADSVGVVDKVEHQAEISSHSAMPSPRAPACLCISGTSFAPVPRRGSGSPSATAPLTLGEKERRHRPLHL